MIFRFGIPLFKGLLSIYLFIGICFFVFLFGNTGCSGLTCAPHGLILIAPSTSVSHIYAWGEVAPRLVVYRNLFYRL